MEQIWHKPLTPPILANNQAHIWRASLDVPAGEIERLTTFLSPDEIVRANKFKFARDKKRFIAARGILRELLANYLQITANQIEFSYSDRGKPHLAASIPDLSLQFNLSHSQNYALYGFTRNCRLGIDLEYLRSMNDAAKIAKRFFSAAESELISSLTADKQKRVFFQLWTAKEAYLKATGEGLAGLLSEIEISITPESSVTLLSVQGNVETAANWAMTSFVPVTDYVGTVVIETSLIQQQIKFLTWN